MKVTRLGPTKVLVGATSLGGSGGTLDPAVGSGLVPTASGSNSWAWGSNVARITADGFNVLGPFVNFAAGSNIVLTLDGAQASNTIRIHSTGGASFGSNSNAVAAANEPGASALSSRADHVHLGVRSLAHSSNSFSGPVILTASGTLGITSPTPGTYNLSAGTGGGGGSAGALVLLEQYTAAASATLDFTSFISSTYDTYIFKFVTIVPATSTAILYMRMGTGGGPTYDTGANYGSQLFRHSHNASALSGADSGATQIALTTAWLAAGNHPIAGSLELYDPQNATWFKWVSGKFVYPDSGISNMVVAEMGGQYSSATAVTAVRFFMSSGNITSGTIRVYGVTKA